MQPKQGMPMLKEDNNASDNIWLYQNKESTANVQDIEKYQ